MLYIRLSLMKMAPCDYEYVTNAAFENFMASKLQYHWCYTEVIPKTNQKNKLIEIYGAVAIRRIIITKIYFGI